jgi:hypothetical protein
VQDGFPTDRVLTAQGRVLAIAFDPATRLVRANTTDAYPLVAPGADGRTFNFSFPFAIPGVSVGDAVVVRPRRPARAARAPGPPAPSPAAGARTATRAPSAAPRAMRAQAVPGERCPPLPARLSSAARRPSCGPQARTCPAAPVLRLLSPP